MPKKTGRSQLLPLCFCVSINLMVNVTASSQRPTSSSQVFKSRPPKLSNTLMVDGWQLTVETAIQWSPLIMCTCTNSLSGGIIARWSPNTGNCKPPISGCCYLSMDCAALISSSSRQAHKYMVTRELLCALWRDLLPLQVIQGLYCLHKYQSHCGNWYVWTCIHMYSTISVMLVARHGT